MEMRGSQSQVKTGRQLIFPLIVLVANMFALLIAPSNSKGVPLSNSDARVIVVRPNNLANRIFEQFSGNTVYVTGRQAGMLMRAVEVGGEEVLRQDIIKEPVRPSIPKAVPCSLQIVTQPLGAGIYVNNKLQG